jgi:hypothetical protein
MKIISFLLIPFLSFSQVATIKLSDGTYIVNAPSGRDWNEEPKGFSVYDEGDTMIYPAYATEHYTTYGNWANPKKDEGCECIYSQNKDDSLVFKFTNAERFEFWGELMSHHGKADIYFNGVKDIELDSYGADNETPTLNYYKANLDKSKIHTFKMVIKGERNQSSTGNYVVLQHFKLIKSVDPPVEPPPVDPPVVEPCDTVIIRDTVYLRPYIYIKADEIEYRIE